MRILSVVGIKAYSRYGYDYLKEITLRIANYQEYTIAEKDFKNLYPSDFEDLHLLLLPRLALITSFFPASDKRSFYWLINLWTLCFPVSNNEWKIMRFNEIYKFSDGTLTNIMEALHYRVKEYKVIIRVLRIIHMVVPEHLSDTYVFTMKMEILLEPTSNKLMVVKGTSRTTNNQAFTIKKGMSMPVQMSQAQDGEGIQTDDQRLDLADDLKEAQDHISQSIKSHKKKITTSKDKILREESKTTS
ncbi:hypothetical protein Tco_0840548 [Tanacetum coccineum]|uniref:Uncharacterized protein n=1 Tax=Tanacetum coccineum TaxID=301880 RepID=A0ABQ5AUZ8_9ASTR